MLQGRLKRVEDLEKSVTTLIAPDSLTDTFYSVSTAGHHSGMACQGPTSEWSDEDKFAHEPRNTETAGILKPSKFRACRAKESG
jgi:hypothetical protein